MYRTGVLRYLWGIVCLAFYVGFVWYLLGNVLSDEGSRDNTGVLGVVVGALLASVFGAVFAPGLSKSILVLTPHRWRLKGTSSYRSGHQRRSGRSSGSSSRNGKPASHK